MFSRKKRYHKQDLIKLIEKSTSRDEASQALGISRRGLRDLLKRNGLDWNEIKNGERYGQALPEKPDNVYLRFWIGIAVGPCQHCGQKACPPNSSHPGGMVYDSDWQRFLTSQEAKYPSQGRYWRAWLSARLDTARAESHKKYEKALCEAISEIEARRIIRKAA